MTLRTQRRLLWGLNAALALGVVACAAGLFLVPVERFDAEGATTSVGVAGVPAAPGEALPLSAYAVIHARNLQRPLYDPKPVVTKPPPPPKPTVTLVGTVIEEGFTYALLKTKAGQVKMASVGQTVDGAEVVGIAADSATIRFVGRTHVLTMQKEGKGS